MTGNRLAGERGRLSLVGRSEPVSRKGQGTRKGPHPNLPGIRSTHRGPRKGPSTQPLHPVPLHFARPNPQVTIRLAGNSPTGFATVETGHFSCGSIWDGCDIWDSKYWVNRFLPVACLRHATFGTQDFCVSRFSPGSFWVWDRWDSWDRSYCCLWGRRRMCLLLRCQSGKWFSDGGEGSGEKGEFSASVVV